MRGAKKSRVATNDPWCVAIDAAIEPLRDPTPTLQPAEGGSGAQAQ
jgi:hypothetical protein